MAPHDPAAVLARDLADVARHAPGRISVSVHDANGPVAEVAGDREVPAASVIGVLVLATLLDELERGSIELDDTLEVPGQRVGGSGALSLLPSVSRLTVDELARLMVVHSDNDAANVLVARLGRDAVARTARAYGLTGTQLRRRFMDLDAAEDNTTTADDMARLVAGLRSGEAAPFSLVQYAFELLSAQQHAVGLTALLPDGVVHASQPGSLRGMRHDVALVETPEGAWAAVAVMATGMEDHRYGQDYSISVLPGFNAIGEAVLAYLTPVPEEE